MKCYFTFGQIHTHSVNGLTLDKDCVAELEAESAQAGHVIGMDLFNGKFHHCTAAIPNMEYYPRGIISLD